jgi:hypothetical protein
VPNFRNPDLKTLHDAMFNLFMRHGAEVCFTPETIAKESGLPVEKLWEPDNFTGLLTDLGDLGYVVRMGTSKASFCYSADHIERSL